MKKNQSNETEPGGGCCLHRLVRWFAKQLMIHNAGWSRADGTDPALTRAWLRRDLRYWNHWPEKGWSARHPIPKSLLERAKPKQLVANLIVNVTCPQSHKMSPDMECKTQNTGGRECEDESARVRETVEQLLRMMRQQEPLQIGAVVMMAPCSPNSDIGTNSVHERVHD
jgi:hypothetical protein